MKRYSVFKKSIGAILIPSAVQISMLTGMVVSRAALPKRVKEQAAAELRLFGIRFDDLSLQDKKLYEEKLTILTKHLLQRMHQMQEDTIDVSEVKTEIHNTLKEFKVLKTDQKEEQKKTQAQKTDEKAEK